MNRYLGTKTKILNKLYEDICRVSRKQEPTVCDIFSGSLAVSLYLKRKGCSVISNDINDLSYVYAKSFLKHNSVPKFNVIQLFANLSSQDYSLLLTHAATVLDEQKSIFDKRNINAEFSSWKEFCRRLKTISMIIAYFQFFTNKIDAKKYNRNDIYENYTKYGKNANYTSLRGTKGKRNYFSKENAIKIDRAINHIRYWYKEKLINEFQRCTLVSILLDTIERCANIQGTYHDFPRNSLEARAKKTIKFFFPNYFGLLYAKKKHFIGKCEDSLVFIKKSPQHDVLYIDPPYNFRQYTSYYFLPNFIAHHSLVPDLDDYISKIKYVRGQNMDYDFNSTFSHREKFLSSLKQLIEKAKCKHIILSYFDGVNHWNKFLKEDNNVGFLLLKDFFNDSNLFEKNNLEIIPVKRINYQSQNGHKAKNIKEFLYIAQKKD